jgi:hypothetical protein
MHNKMGEGHVCHLPFEDHDVSLLSTKHVALRKTIAQEIAYHKHIIQTQANQTIEMYLFSNLDLLICYDKKDMVKDHDL